METFKYKPLDLDRSVLRLLRLCHGNTNTISCELFQTELYQRDDTISYDALSYTWGSHDLAEVIYVNSCRLKVTHDLYQAMLHLRHEDEDRLLWIHDICINHEDKKEKGHQVAHMGDIYKEANRVVFLLGPGSYATDIFMESLQLLQERSAHHACGAWPPQDSRWENLWPSSLPHLREPDSDLTALQRDGLREILGQPWFRRVWTIQEVAFANDGVISCGTKSAPARLFGLTPLLLGVIPDDHCQSVINIMPSPWRASSWLSQSRSREPLWRSQGRSLYKLLLNFGNIEATDSRDVVYALRSMASDLTDQSSLFPDYEKSEAALVRDVVRFIHHCEIEDMELPQSIRELIEDLPTLSQNICIGLAKRSLPFHIEKLLKNPEIPVSQEVLQVTAQHDKTGEVVEVLLRCREGGFEVDDQVLLCAAKNAGGAKKVFEVFSRYQDQLIITQAVFMTALYGCGRDVADFLLSMKNARFDTRHFLAG